jgi:hypothetical protein
VEEADLNAQASGEPRRLVVAFSAALQADFVAMTEFSM